MGSLRVLGPGEPRGDLALHLDHELVADPARDVVRLGRVRAIDDDLGDPVAVAQVQEDQLAVVAASMDPAGESGGRAASVARNAPQVWVR